MSEPAASGGSPGAAPRRSVHLEADAVEAIRRRARASAPAECCGALIGLATESGGPGRPAATAGVVRVARVLATPNAALDDRHYVLAPEDVRRAETEAAEAGLEVVGFYHSHAASAPVPSPTDLEAAWPWYSYLIVDARTGEARAWRLADDRTAFVEEELRVAEPEP